MKKGDRVDRKPVERERIHEMKIVLQDGSTFLQYDTFDKLIKLADSFSGDYRKLTLKPAGTR